MMCMFVCVVRMSVFVFVYFLFGILEDLDGVENRKSKG